MTEFRGQPAYLQLADDLRERIRSGKLATGAALPSAQELIATSGASSTVVKNAVSLLRAEGYVVGHQGKGSSLSFRLDSRITRAVRRIGPCRFCWQAWRSRQHYASHWARTAPVPQTAKRPLSTGGRPSIACPQASRTA